MFCVGLTGTIASGKSTVASWFKHSGVDVVNADEIARQLTTKNHANLNLIIQHFGGELLTADGDLNRRQLRRRIINNPHDKEWIESLLHPQIRQHIEHSITHCQSPYCIIEIPLLTERASYPYLNRVLLVESHPDLQLKRLMARDQCTEAEANALLTTQSHNNTRQAIADDVVLNTTTPNALFLQLNTLHQHYLKLAAQSAKNLLD